MKPLQVGQRVRLKGKVAAEFNPKEDKLVCVELESGDWVIVTPSQCTRLVKKKRRRVWIKAESVDELLRDSNEDSYSLEVANKPLRSGSYWVEFVEARPKRRRG